jgi:NAD(P)-dependent dehydrogenase (short-subunit alcohol dehydrogenase family)
MSETPSGKRGRVAVVTGGSKGIGLAIAEALLAQDYAVVIASRNEAAVEAVGRELEQR